MKCGCSIYFFLNSANQICRSTVISKYFRESIELRDNESRLHKSIQYGRLLNESESAIVLSSQSDHALLSGADTELGWFGRTQLRLKISFSWESLDTSVKWNTLILQTPALYFILFNKSISLSVNMCKIFGWVANSIDPDQTPRSAVSDLGLQGQLRPVYPNTQSTAVWSNRTLSEIILNPPLPLIYSA